MPRSTHRGTCKMSRGLQSRISGGTCNVVAGERTAQCSTSSAGRSGLPVRVVGAPVGLTLPRIVDLPINHVFQSDNQPTMKFALSMMRLGMIRLGDWKGNVASLIHKGLTRYCEAQGLREAKKVFAEGTIGFIDELSELDCYTQMGTVRQQASGQMLLAVYYAHSAMVPIGPTLKAFRAVNESLADAFYEVVRHNLGRWMRTYDYTDALCLAERQIEMMDESEAKESYYPDVENQCKQWMPRKLPSYKRSVKFLQASMSHLKCDDLKRLIALVLKMHEHGKKYETAWPSHLCEVVPGMQDFLDNTDQPGPGVLIAFEEDDLVNACFDEEMQYLGNDYAIGPSLMLMVDLTQPDKALDAQVKRMFAHVGAMLRSLSVGAELILSLRKINDEDLRRRRLEPRVQTGPGVAAVPEG